MVRVHSSAGSATARIAWTAGLKPPIARIAIAIPFRKLALIFSRSLCTVFIGLSQPSQNRTLSSHG
jgi:hypothetical protein